jgi:hypothetical protein
MDLPKIIEKPSFYHYTRPELIGSILESQSLWARATWDFDDKQEYRHGLELIARVLKDTYSGRREAEAIPALALELMRRCRVDVRRVLELTINHIEYEVDAADKPKVEVYVACTTTQGNSLEMVKNYGGVVIRFNWMLPLLAYGYPRPLATSMLSYVTYDEREFMSRIMEQGFIFGFPEYLPKWSALLDPMNTEEREASIAATAAIFLCVFAPNIKKPKFAFEREWRLKTVKLNHSIPTLFSIPDEVAIQLRRHFGMSEEAAFTKHSTPRYLQELRGYGKMIIDHVAVSPTVPKEMRAEVLRVVAKHNDNCLGPAIPLREAWLLRWSQENGIQPAVP